MEPDAGIAATITSSVTDDTAQFVLRRHPDNSSKVLLMLSNNHFEAADVVVIFPPSIEISQISQLHSGLNFPYTYDSVNKTLKFELEAFRARALIIDLVE